MFKESAFIDCSMIGELYDKDGNLKQTVEKHNLILDDGFDFICNAIAKTTGRPNALSHIAVGTNSTAASASDSGLKRELVRSAATYTHTAGTKFFTMVATFAAGVGTGALTETGLCNASSGGVTMDRVVFPVVNKQATDTFKVTFQFVLSEKA